MGDEEGRGIGGGIIFSTLNRVGGISAKVHETCALKGQCIFLLRNLYNYKNQIKTAALSM